MTSGATLSLSPTRRGEFECVQQTHAEYYFRLALAARSHLVAGGDQAVWLDRLDLEHNNLRAALTWAVEDPARAEFALTLAEAMYHFWNIRGYLSEGRCWLEKALALSDTPTELRARALNSIGRLAQVQGDYGSARAFHEQALVVQEFIGDDPGMCRSLENLAILSGSQGDYEHAGGLLEQSLAVRRKIGDRPSLMPTLNNLAIVNRRRSQYARAEELYLESAAIARETDSHKALSHALNGLGEIRLMQDDPVAALAFFRESVAIRHQLGNRPDLPTLLGNIAMAFYRQGDGLTAARLISASESLRKELGIAVQPSNRAEIEENIANVRALVGDAAFEQAWAKGRAMSLDEAVAVALGKDARHLPGSKLS